MHNLTFLSLLDSFLFLSAFSVFLKTLYNCYFRRLAEKSLLSRFPVLIHLYTMWSSNLFSASNCFPVLFMVRIFHSPDFSGFRFSWVQVFQGRRFLGFGLFWFQILGPGPSLRIKGSSFSVSRFFRIQVFLSLIF